MSKKLTLFIFTVLFYFSSSAQKYEISDQFTYKVGTPYTVVDGTKYYFKNEESFFSLKISRKHGVILQKYSTDKLTEVDKKTYDDLHEHAVMEAVITIKDRHYMFYGVWDKPNKTEYLYAREIGSDLSLSAPFEILSSTYPIAGTLGNKGFMNFTTTNKYDFYLNNSEEALLIKYKIKPLEKKNKINKDIYGFFVFNPDLEEIWGDEIKMPYTESRMLNYGFSIDGENNVFFLSKVKRSDERKAPTYEVLFRIDSETKEMRENKIKLDGFDPRSYSLFEDNNGNIIMTGLAATDKKGGVNSFFKVVYDYDGEIESQSNTNFMDNIQDDIVKKKRKKDVDVNSLDNMVIRDIVLKEDGSMVVTAEHFRVEIHHSPDAQGRTRTYYTYHYESILALKIDEEGEIVWARLLPKKQAGKKVRGGMSYFYFEKGGKHYFIYLDHIKNLDPEATKLYTHSDGAGGFLTAYEVNDETGEVTKLSLMDIKKVEINGKKMDLKQLTMDRFVPVGEGDFIFETYIGKKKDVLIRCTIE